MRNGRAPCCRRAPAPPATTLPPLCSPTLGFNRRQRETAWKVPGGRMRLSSQEEYITGCVGRGESRVLWLLSACTAPDLVCLVLKGLCLSCSFLLEVTRKSAFRWCSSAMQESSSELYLNGEEYSDCLFLKATFSWIVTNSAEIHCYFSRILWWLSIITGSERSQCWPGMANVASTLEHSARNKFHVLGRHVTNSLWKILVL